MDYDLHCKVFMFVASPQGMRRSTLKHWLVILGFALFLASIAGVYFGVRSYWGRFSNTSTYLQEISVVYWVLIALAGALYYLLDYTRLYALLRLLGTRLTLYDGLKAISIPEVASVVVPTGVLHLPTTIFVLNREGINVGDATAAVVTRTVYTIVWVSMAGFASLLFTSTAGVPGVLSGNLVYCLLPVVSVILLFVAMVVFAPRVHRWLQRQVLARIRHRWVKMVFEWLDRAEEDIGAIGHSTSRHHLFAHLSSIGMVLMYCVLGFLIANASGLELSFPTAIGVFSISLLLIYISPVAGTIGVSELATAYLLNPEVGPREIFIAVVLRIISRYVLLLPGLILLLLSVRAPKVT
jgi:uncharacterized protein (TIRG00374 family)